MQPARPRCPVVRGRVDIKLDLSCRLVPQLTNCPPHHRHHSIIPHHRRRTAAEAVSTATQLIQVATHGGTHGRSRVSRGHASTPHAPSRGPASIRYSQAAWVNTRWTLKPIYITDPATHTDRARPADRCFLLNIFYCCAA